MSAAAISNPASSQGESKNPRKKKAKGDTGTPASEGAAGGDAGGVDAKGGPELDFLRDLHKNVRNVKKKIAATQKVDSIVAENPDLSLDDLLATKKINADQKQQAERKPALQANLRELEAELDRYKRIEDSVAEKHEAEKAALKLEHEKELSALRQSKPEEPAVPEAQQFPEQLLHLSKFLRAAATRRQDGDETAEESRAFEGALLLVYGGDTTAVQAMENIIAGSDELVPTVEGTRTMISYKKLRDVFTDGEGSAPLPDAGSATDTQQTSAPEASIVPESDMTQVNAGLTEMDISQADAVTVNGGAPTGAPESSLAEPRAANAAAESSWHNMTSSVTSGPDDWVQVNQIPRDPSETESGAHGVPAAVTSTQSWAEDVPAEPAAPPPQPAPPANDGFHEVHHGRVRGRGGSQGDFRGRGRGGFRGDRGDGSFRGRGGFRGDRGGGEGGPRGRGRGGFRGPRGGRGESGPS